MSWTENSLQDVKQTYFFFCFFSFWSIDQRQTSTFQLFFTPTTAKKRNPAWVLTSGSNQVVRSWQCLLLLLSASKSRMVSWHCRHESVQVQFLLCWGGGGVGSVGVEGGGRVVCGVPGTLVRPVNPAVVFGCGFKRPEDANLSCHLSVNVCLHFAFFPPSYSLICTEKWKRDLKKNKKKTTTTTTTQRWKNEWRRPTRFVWEEMG